MNDSEVLEKYSNAKFIGYIKVGNKGINEYYTDKATYERRRDRVWDSGHDFESRIIKDEI